jgi:hypothetical protein
LILSVQKSPALAGHRQAMMVETPIDRHAPQSSIQLGRLLQKKPSVVRAEKRVRKSERDTLR